MGLKGTDEQERWIELDGVRGLAALLVVYAHLFLMWIPASPAPVFWLRTLSGQAWTGVYLFYVLSGFLIGGVLLKHRRDEGYFRVFYTRRGLRILPVYFLLLGLFSVVRVAPGLQGMPEFSPGRIPFGDYLLLIQNFAMARTGDWGAAPLGVTWSVALEEQFYLFLPLWVRLLPARWLPLSFLGLAAFGPVFRGFVALKHPPFLVPGSGEALFFGTWLAWAFTHKPELFRRTIWLRCVLGIWLASACGMAATLLKCDFGIFTITIITTFWASFLWLTLAHLGTAWTAPLRHVALRAVGNVSYAVYLFHPLITLLLFVALTGAPARQSIGALRGGAISLLALGCTFAFAALSYFCMERRLIAFGRRFRYHRPVPANPAGPGLTQ